MKGTATNVISIKNYRKTAIPDTPEEPSDEMRERSELCEKLGLDSQADVVDTRDPKAFYPEITRSEHKFWGNFLPAVYSKARGNWKGYHCDVIPSEVLREIDTARNLKIFTDFEIWTPEQQFTDPVVVGVVGARTYFNNSLPTGNARFFMISRWGNSLIPFEEIVKTVLARLIYKNGHAVPPVVQMSIEGYVSEQNALPRAYLYGRSRFLHRHCGRPSYWFYVDPYSLFICARCGTILKKKYNGASSLD